MSHPSPNASKSPNDSWDSTRCAEPVAPAAFIPPITLTVLSNEAIDPLTNQPLPISKTFALDSCGALTKNTTAKLTRGRARQETITSLTAFAALLESLAPYQALAYGVTEHRDVAVVTKEKLRSYSGAISRSREYFRFRSAPTILFLDYDVSNGIPMTPDELRDTLIRACPALAHAPMVAQSSASSFIFQGNTQLRGPAGWHFYVPVLDGSDIARAGRAIYEQLWRIGSGYFSVSKSGQLLDRNVIDDSVWQPERLDFAAGAACVPPLQQRRPPVKLWNVYHQCFDTRNITEPTREERDTILSNRAVAKTAVEDERCSRRDEYTACLQRAHTARGVNDTDARTIITDAIDRAVLLGDFPLTEASGRRVTVAEVLARKAEYHGARFADPLEPDYRDDNRIAVANLYGGGRPYIYSHAHGGRRFALFPQPSTLRLVRGELPRLAEAVLDRLRIAADVYDQPLGDSQHRLVYVREGNLIPVTDAWLRTYIGKLFRCERFDKRSMKPEAIDVPKELVEAIQGDTTDRRLQLLETVVSDPIMRSDGSILDTPGYSERDHLLFESHLVHPPRIPLDPTDDELQSAFRDLWHPFRQFPLVSDADRAVLVAALLTTLVRPVLDTAPGFVFDAPSAGSGKTRLAQCISWLAGVAPHEESPPSTDEETAKRLFALLRGGAKVILWDNYTQPIYGTSALSSFLTAGRWRARVLGASQTEAVANRALFLATGNNVRIQGDACRRLLVCRIDAGIERPSMRTFDLEPATWVRDHRQTMRIAALTILRGFKSRGSPRQVRTTAGSFEDWDRLVRQCVIWFGRSGLADLGIGDPHTSAEINMDGDTEGEVLVHLLKAWYRAFGERWMAAGELLDAARFPDHEGRNLLKDAINGISGNDAGFNDRRFGRWLQKHRDLPLGGLKIVSIRKDNAYRYAVIRLDISSNPLVTPTTDAALHGSETNTGFESISELLGPPAFLIRLSTAGSKCSK